MDRPPLDLHEANPRVAALRSLLGLHAGRRRKWLALGIWLFLIGGAGAFAGRLSTVENNNATTWLPANAESTRALQVALDHFGAGQQTAAVIVFVRQAGLTVEDRAAVERDRVALAPYTDGGVGQPVQSQDGRALLLSVPLKSDPNNGTMLMSTVKEVRRIVRANDPSGLQVKVTGQAGLGADLGNAFAGLDTTLLLGAAGVVAVLLLVIYRSPFLWLVPLVVAGIASQVAGAAVYLLARYAGLTVNGLSAGIMDVLVLGVGTDYALLLIARYREELRTHMDRHAAMAEALRRSLPPILASAITVAAALLCLLAAQMNSTRSLGPVAAVGVLTTLVTMTTLLPALLLILGRWVFWPFVPRCRKPNLTDTFQTHAGWERIARGVARRPRLLWTGSALALGALAFGALGLSTGLTQEETFTSRPDSVTGDQLVAQHFPAGASLPVQTFARAPSAAQVADVLRSTAGVARVLPPQRSGDWVLIDALLASAPNSEVADQTVTRIRDRVHSIAGADALVGGPTASTVDTTSAVMHDEELAMPVVLVVVFLVLAVLLRALVAPLVLLGSVALSFLAALGTSSLLFHAIGHPKVDQSLFLDGFIFLVALGVDYTIFLMTRAREEVTRVGHEPGILRALAATGGVITSAGMVLAGTFAVLSVLPVVTTLQLGLLVAVGVLLDTVVIRTLLVPAFALDVGGGIWWPSRLGVPTAAAGGRRDRRPATASKGESHV